ncbi:hypothetical protein OIV83_002089 [Microbotryomycetes sp. JL201]|nr:hypothetical protein OIV83_002089 [Microbotryomycetes sp. JL201]
MHLDVARGGAVSASRQPPIEARDPGRESFVSPAARRRRPEQRQVTTSIARRINDAFASATDPNFDGDKQHESSNKLPRKPKRNTKMIVLDDEDEQMSEVDTTAAAATATAAPAAMPDMTIEADPLPLPIPERAAQDGGGGFLTHHDDILPTNGAGFFTDNDTSTGGGFLPELGNEAFGAGGDGGGFMPELPLLDSNHTFGGGFLTDDNAFTEGGGGFLPDDAEMPELPPLPDLPPIPSTSTTSHPATTRPIPTAPPRVVNRISLRKIPQALEQLDLPADSKDLLDLFREVASDDETVSKERFFEACAALMSDVQDTSDDNSSSSQSYKEEQSSSDERERRRQGSKLKRLDGTAVAQTKRATPRRSTRANPAGDEEETAKAAIAKARTRIDEDDDDLALSEGQAAAYDSANANDKGSASATSSKNTASKGRKSKGKVKLKQPRKLTVEELRDAEDTFELFFEGDSRKQHARDKVLTLTDLQRVTRLLKEDMSEDDLQEMIEYAARERGQVDLEAFTKVLAEAL